jgi:hypothetical protein
MCWIVVVFANNGVIITGGLMIILGAEMRKRVGLITGWAAVSRYLSAFADFGVVGEFEFGRHLWQP